MKYWDSSALVPLLLAEPRTSTMRAILGEDGQVSTFWATEVECASAIARRQRAGRLDHAHVSLALDRLGILKSGWSEVQPADALRERARRLLRIHPLRTSDSLQLAAALVASDDSPSTLPFVCLDARLRSAADREGFPLVPHEL